MRLIILTAMTYAGTAVAFSIDQNLSALVAVFVATVGMVVAVLNWLDKRIQNKININAANNNLRFELVVQEIRHLKVFLGYKEPQDEGTTMRRTHESTPSDSDR